MWGCIREEIRKYKGKADTNRECQFCFTRTSIQEFFVMLLEAFLVGKSAKFWILIQKMLELIGMICFFWRVSIFCFSFNKLFTFLPSQSSIHLLHLRQWVGQIACLELLFGRATGCCYNVHWCRMGLIEPCFWAASSCKKQDNFSLPAALKIPPL